MWLTPSPSRTVASYARGEGGCVMVFLRDGKLKCWIEDGIWPGGLMLLLLV